MFKLIVSDMDGTLLRDDHTISDYTKSVIQRTVAASASFMLATGRIFGGARHYAEDLGLNTPILACNGALIKEANGNKLYGKPLSPQAAADVFQLLTEERYYFHFYGEDTYYTKELSPLFSRMYQFNQSLPENRRFAMKEVNPFDIPGQDDIYKILAHWGEGPDGNELREKLARIPGVAVTSSWHNTFDISAEGVSKSTAIARYAMEHGIAAEEIMCFGDNFNDIEMIQSAGLGIAVENAVPSLKQAANYIAGSNNQDGVAKAIEKFLFSQNEG